jgi:anti-sigma B factor antagonist
LRPGRPAGERWHVELSQSRTGDGQVAVVHVAGELDMATVGELHDALDSAFGLSSSGVVLDLTGVAFFDSSGLHALDEIRQEAAAHGAPLALVCPHERLMRLFEITELKELFTFYPSVSAAGEAMSAAS